MGITITIIGKEVTELRAENQRLRDEVGEITIADPTKLHAIQVESGDELVWKWRVWLPAGHRYKLRSDGGEGEIPKSRFPTTGTTIWWTTKPGQGEEIWITYEIKKRPASGKWYGGIKTKRAAGGSDYHPWVESRDGARCSTYEGVGRVTKMGDLDERMLLTRWRTASVNRSSDIPDPADGFIIWIEPQ